MLGAYQALARQIAAGKVTMYPRTEMLDLVVVDGRARGIVTRDLVTGKVESHVADAVILATGGYGNVFFLSTNAKGCNVTATWRAHKLGAGFANPCFTQIHPTCIPVSGDHQSKLTLMSESLRNDGRVWVPARAGDGRKPGAILESERDYYLERRYPTFGNLVPRDVASRAAKAVCDEGKGVGSGGRGVYLDFADASQRLGEEVVRERYGNLFDMYERITGENPYQVPMRIYPAVHYAMGGLWVDYNLMSTIPGLFVLGEANFSDHGANRLGASALMQGLADGYFVVPYTVGNYLAGARLDPVAVSGAEFKRTEADVGGADQALAGRARANAPPPPSIESSASSCGTTAAWRATPPACVPPSQRIPELREEFWRQVLVPGSGSELNQSLEYAGRVADFLEFAELLCQDALERAESCGCHFREEFQTAEGEAKRNDAGIRARRGLGTPGAGAGAAPAQGIADLRERAPGTTELQMKLTLMVWRQENRDARGRMQRIEATDIRPDMSFLEMLDVVNERLTLAGERPIAFDHDCREGICGMCGVVINGVPHGPRPGTTTCQLHMRHFRDGQTIVIEPFRAKPFPVLRDLIVDRSALDRMIAAGGYISVSTGSAPDGNAIPVAKPERGRGHGRRRVHRLRRLRGRVPQRLGHAVRGRQDLPPRAAAAGSAGALDARREHGGGHGPGGLRPLHQRDGVYRGLSQGNRPGRHRAHE